MMSKSLDEFAVATFAISACAAALLGSTDARAIDLVLDVNATQAPAVYSRTGPDSIDLANGTLLTLSDSAHGAELWFTDGATPSNTRLVRDICRGEPDAIPARFVRIQDFVLFWATDCVSGIELWRSDGTREGTYMVADIGPGNNNYGGAYMTAVINDTLIFSANDGTSGTELWRSDGTAAGTYQLADIMPGPNSSDPDGFTASASHVFFHADVPYVEGGHFEEVWVTDGTIEGTRAVAQVTFARDFTAVGDSMFFSANDATHGVELWRAAADGTDAQMVENINTAPTTPGYDQGSYPSGMFELEGSLIFSAFVGSGPSQSFKLFRADQIGTGVTELAGMPSGGSPTRLIRLPGSALFGLVSQGVADPTEIWMTDGTAANTGPLNLDVEYSSAFNVAYGNGEAFFFARQPSSNGQDHVWRTDGTRAGTRLYTDVVSNTVNANIAYSNGRVYFEAGNSTHAAGNELWSSDGTAEGTYRVSDIVPGAGSSIIAALRVARNRLLFFAGPNILALEPWTSDGTTTGTHSLNRPIDGSANADSEIAFAGRIDDRMLFAADDGVHGRELWITDGSSSGTRLLKDIVPGGNGSEPSAFTSLGDVMLFVAADWDHGPELWRTDGSPDGTFMLADIRDGGEGSNIALHGAASVINGVAYFTAADSTGRARALWRSDGTVAGTYRVEHPVGHLEVYVLANTGTRMLLGTLVASGQAHVWSTDGTPGSETIVHSGLRFVPGPVLGPVAGRGCFRAWDSSPRLLDVWCSNGSVGDLIRATNLAALGLSAQEVWGHNGLLFVNAAGTTSEGGLYVSNGSDSSMQLLSTERIVSAQPSSNRLIYMSQSSSLVATDGTVSGTRDLLEGTPVQHRLQGPFGIFGGFIVFSVNDPEEGPVLWRTDGTPSGARYLADTDPYRTASSNADSVRFAQLGDLLLFTALRTGIGHELFSMNATHPNASDDRGSGQAGSGIEVAVLTNDSDFDGSIEPSSLVILSGPRSGSATVDAARGTITYLPNSSFSGTDELTYRVSDDQGNESNIGRVQFEVTAGPTPPPPPNPTPPSTPPPSGGNSGGGGGGGAFGLELLIAALALLHRRRRLDGMRKFHQRD